MRSIDKIRLEAKNGTWSHAYLFVGNDVAGIEEAIDYIITSRKCLVGDIIRVKPEEKDNKAGEIKGDQIRDFIRQIGLTSGGVTRIGIIESCDKLNITSGNVLLKTIEEPPKNVMMILVAKTEQVITTIKSRCRIYHFEIGVEEDHNYSYDSLFRGTLVEGFRKIEEIVKNEETMRFLEGLSSYLLLSMSQTHSIKTAKLVEETELVKKKIKGNANQRLTLENLFLDIKDNI
jgi:DNA polymerase III delta prime subunit